MQIFSDFIFRCFELKVDFLLLDLARNQGNYIFAKLFETVYWYDFELCVKPYQGNLGLKTFKCWEEFLVMSFVHFCYIETLRDI